MNFVLTDIIGILEQSDNPAGRQGVIEALYCILFSTFVLQVQF